MTLQEAILYEYGPNGRHPNTNASMFVKADHILMSIALSSVCGTLIMKLVHDAVEKESVGNTAVRLQRWRVVAKEADIIYYG